MGNSNKQSTSKLGKLFRHPTLLVFVLCLAVFAGANIYAAVKESGVADAAVPSPDFESWLSQLNTYHARKAGYPPSLVELEREIWMPLRKGEDAKVSRLEYGPRMRLHRSYAYLYQRDARDPSICSLWAVPQGERYKEANTYYLLITPKSVTAWQGGALTVDQMRSIPAAARPTGEDMARLGMYKQSALPQVKRSRSIFPFLNL